jgi:hypothetical protein
MGEPRVGSEWERGPAAPGSCPQKPAFVRAAGLLLAFGGALLVNCFLTLHVWLPSYNFAGMAIPSTDFLALFALMTALSRVGARWYRWGLGALLLVAAFLLVFSTGESVTVHVYERSFLPRTDLPYFLEFIRLLFQAENSLETALFASLFCLFFVALIAGVSLLIARVSAYLRSRESPLLAGAVLLCSLFVLALVPAPSRFLTNTLAGSILGAFGPGGRGVTVTPETGTTALVPEGTRSVASGRVPARNVLLFIVESYGYTAFAKEEHRDALAPVYEEAEAKLRNAGYTLFSRFFSSPVIGGYSWYADASLLTGNRIDSKEKYEELMASDSPSMFSALEDRGYGTVLAAPGTLKPWPEGERFYRFDWYFFDADFGYRGPNFSFVPVPDQFSIRIVHERLLEGSAVRPLFIVYLLVSSHAPFNRIPPYIDDWELLGDGSVYHSTPSLTFDNNWFRGNEYPEGYTAAVRYELEVLADYMVRFVRDDSLAIIVGDHQPKYPITGKGQPLSVPMHAICRDAAALEPLRSSGFAEGLIPGLELPHPGLESFFPLFIDVVETADRVEGPGAPPVRKAAEFTGREGG